MDYYGFVRHEVIQVHPTNVDNTFFAGCFMVIEEIKNWGCVLRMSVPGKGHMYYRAKWAEISKLQNNQARHIFIEPGEGYAEI